MRRLIRRPRRGRRLWCRPDRVGRLVGALSAGLLVGAIIIAGLWALAPRSPSATRQVRFVLTPPASEPLVVQGNDKDRCDRPRWLVRRFPSWRPDFSLHLVIRAVNRDRAARAAWHDQRSIPVHLGRRPVGGVLRWTGTSQAAAGRRRADNDLPHLGCTSRRQLGRRRLHCLGRFDLVTTRVGKRRGAEETYQYDTSERSTDIRM